MKKCMRLSLGMLMMVAASAMCGATQFVAKDSDMMSIRGSGQFQLVNGTVIHKHDADGEWYGLFSRNKDSQDIVLNVEDGTYYVETWSIASNPMSPQRTHKGMEVVIGDGSNPQPPSFGVSDMLALLAAWGPCAGNCPYDFTGDGFVGVPDLLYLMSNWGG